MIGKIPKQKNIYEIPKSSNGKLLLNKFNSSKVRLNSTTLFLEQFQKEYSTKYFQTNNKNKKGDTPKHLSNNFVLRTPKHNDKNLSHFNNNLSNNLESYLDKLYQNEKHLKKNILKKKKDENSKHKKKINSKVPFMNFTPKNKILKSNIKKLTFSNYVDEKTQNKFDLNEKNTLKENIQEEEDGQSYGYNKKYSLQMIDENDYDKKIIKNDEITPELSKNSMYNDYKLNEINIIGDDTHKTFNTTNVKSSEANKIKPPHLKIKKSKSKQNLKKLKKKGMKLSKEQDKKNNNNNNNNNNNKVVNINYNINVNNENNSKYKKNKHGTKKSSSIYKENHSKTEKEISEDIKNKDEIITQKVSSLKDNENKNIIKTKGNRLIKLYKLNCCYPFLNCLKCNND